MKTSFILVAAGKGTRLGRPKWSVKLAGKTLLQWNLEKISRLPIQEKQIIVVVPSGEVEHIRRHLPDTLHDVQVVAGGVQRIDSVRSGLERADGEILLIHNVANPLALEEDFLRLQELLEREDAIACVGQPVVDTLRRVDEQGFETLDRQECWRVQTPQAFRTDRLQKKLLSVDQIPTDEISLFEEDGLSFRVFPTSPLNMKITFPEDLDLMEGYLRTDILVGAGEDSHCFDESGTIILGGVSVEGVPKLKGNSDGDLVLHALFNAVSSALGKRSIGPTADPMAEQGIIDSTAYLDVILKEMRELGYRIGNVSLSLEGSVPKIEPLVEPMKGRLSEILDVDRDHIGITATSGENLSSFGRGEGVRCACLVSLVRSNNSLL